MIESAKKIQILLNSSGYKTLAAGGFVRDTLLGKSPKDIDLATEALPEQVREVLTNAGITVIDTGIKHGTVSAIINKVPYEITTLRIDKKCFGREAEVEFVKSFKEDASRRDFTINAMFMDLTTGEVLDFFNGKEDLKNKIIRFVGNPEDRVKEDYLRILRLFRFSSQLSFNIDVKASETAIKYLPYMMSYISTERILSEISKLIIGEGVLYILKEFKELIFSVFPELKLTDNFQQRSAHHIWDVYTHIILGVDYLKKFKNPTLSFGHLFHDIAKPFCHSVSYVDGNPVDHFYEHDYHGAKVAQRICHRLKMPSEDTKKICFIVENHMRFHFKVTSKSIRKFIHACSEEGDIKLIWDMFSIFQADLYGQANKKVDVEGIKALIEEGLDFFNKPKITSPVSGLDIMNILGIKAGPNVGKVKSYLIDKIVEEGINPEDKEYLWSLAKEFASKNKLF